MKENEMDMTCSTHSRDVRSWSKILKSQFSRTRYKRKYNIVTYRPVARQTPRNKQRDNSRCYAIIVRLAVILATFLSNGLVNTFLRQRLRMQRWRRGVAYAVRAEELKRR
jgi:hypothetical protein